MSDFATLMEMARVAGLAVAPPANVDVPAVTGSGLVGAPLACTMGNWSGEPTGYAYAWQADGAANEATGDTYTPVALDVGKSLCCVVTATNGAGSAAAPPSNAIVVVAAASREAPGAAAGERARNRS